MPILDSFTLVFIPVILICVRMLLNVELDSECSSFPLQWKIFILAPGDGKVLQVSILQMLMYILLVKQLNYYLTISVYVIIIIHNCTCSLSVVSSTKYFLMFYIFYWGKVIVQHLYYWKHPDFGAQGAKTFRVIYTPTQIINSLMFKVTKCVLIWKAQGLFTFCLWSWLPTAGTFSVAT